MVTGYIKLKLGIAVLLLSALLTLLVGCGRDKDDASSGGDAAAPKVTVQMDSLPTMPSAKFSEPTTMITPEADQTKAALEASATSEVTATVEATGTVEPSTSVEITATVAPSSTVEVTATETVSATN